MYSFSIGKLPNIFDNYFTRNSVIHSHATRNSEFYHVPIYRSGLGNNSIKKVGVSLWEDISYIADQSFTI